MSIPTLVAPLSPMNVEASEEEKVKKRSLENIKDYEKDMMIPLQWIIPEVTSNLLEDMRKILSTS